MTDTKRTEKVKEKTTARVESKTFTGRIVETPKVAPKVAPKLIIQDVYSADFSVIDNTIEEIKKQTRKVGKGEYACNNIYIILEDALKKVILAYK
jgi:hypothetical protein